MEIWYYLNKKEGRTNIGTFFNNNFSNNIVCRSIKPLAVIVRSTLEGSVAHFFDIGHSCFFMLLEKIHFFTFNIIKE